MKKSYIAIIIIVLVAVALFFVVKSQNLEAPTPAYDQTGYVNDVPGTTTVTTTTTPAGSDGVVCTMDAKLCPDGSYVGRGGPKCEFAACPEVKAQTVKEFTVSGQNFSFTPSTMTVKKGDKVKITFKNMNGNHNLIIDEFNVNTGTVASGAQKTVEFTADKTGSFQYYCSVGTHRAMGMWGTLTVQ